MAAEAGPAREAWRQDRIAELLPAALKRQGLDCWIVLTRENNPDPLAWDVGLEHAVLTAAGVFLDRGDRLETVAICASFDTTPVTQSGIYDRIIAYKSEGALPHLRDLLREASPRRIGVNVSESSPMADGLSVGLHRYLKRALGAKLSKRLVSAEEMVAGFRCRRLPAEIAHFKRAVAMTEDILRRALSPEAITPGVTTEKSLAGFIRARMEELGVGPSWAADHCPNIWTRLRGHGGPSDRVIERGDLVSIDFGINLGGYCTDIQRSAYVLREGEAAPPEKIVRLWETVVRSNQAAVAAMAPGAAANAADVAARQVVTEAGYEEYAHAAGHPVGFYTHEIGPLPGPDWPDRYGAAVFRTLEAGQIYAIEPSAGFDQDGERINTGLEEEVLVTESGAEYLSTLQRELVLIK